jgi:hypothetical protein
MRLYCFAGGEPVAVYSTWRQQSDPTSGAPGIAGELKTSRPTSRRLMARLHAFVRAMPIFDVEASSAPTLQLLPSRPHIECMITKVPLAPTCMGEAFCMVPNF